MQGWRTHQAGKLTYKTDAYKWLNPNKDGTYESNHIKSPIRWQLLVINLLESNLNYTFRHKYSKDRDDGWTNHNKRAYIHEWEKWEADNSIGL